MLNHNFAQKGGAIHSFNKIPIIEKSNIFLDNKANYGNDYSSFAVQFAIIKYTTNGTEQILKCDSITSIDDCNFPNFVSGQTFNNFTFCLLDSYGQKMILEQGYAFLDLASVKIINSSLDNNPNKYFLGGIKSSKIINGITKFDFAYIVGTPNTCLNLLVTSNLITKFYAEIITKNKFHDFSSETNQYYFVAQVHLRVCVKGEIYFILENICFKCPKGTFSLSTSDSSCSDCPTNAFCEGGDQIVVDPGYWRFSVDSVYIYQCNSISSPCLGGYNSTCYAGYTGITCGECFYNAYERSFKKGLYYCDTCTNVWIYALAVFIALIVIFRYIFLLESNDAKDKFSYILIKIIATHFQTLNFVSNIKIDVPSFLNEIFNIQAPFSTADSLFNLIECLPIKFISNYILKLIFSIIFLVFVILIIVIFLKIKTCYKKSKCSTSIFKINLLTALVIATSFFQPWLINFYIENISCDNYDGVQYLVNDLQQECWNSTHFLLTMLITLPFLILLMIVFPLVN